MTAFDPEATAAMKLRETALANYYAAERRAGACPIVANERMSEFAKRLDDLQYQRELDLVRFCIGRTA